MSLNKPIDQITEKDLHQLIEDKVAETQTIEYKKELHLDQDVKKDEFRKDISALANASGGHFIVGMDAPNGMPINLCGMDIPNHDSFKLRLDELLQSKISPRIPGYSIHICTLSNDKSAVIIHVPQSFNKPHQITTANNDFQFWARNSGGCYRLNVDNLRSIILQSETLNERIRAFRQDRLSNIIAGETPVSLVPGARTILHMIPLSSFNSGVRYDLTELEIKNQNLTLAPSSYDYNFGFRQFNFDGLISISERTNQLNVTDSYLQVFRTRTLESVEAESINRSESTPNWKSLDEQRLIAAVDRGKSLMRHLGIEPPILILVTLVGVKDHIIYRGQNYYLSSSTKFGRDVLQLPDVLVNDFDKPANEIVRPILDAIWNAGGYPKCLNYDDSGKYQCPNQS